ncbi:fibronectin-binding domain-containing protein [Candidatus Bathyarchaeota archaeon]|nr:fibronectin-binding domain-containing protein [Candidatus Bathyarchaeota archaeon]
MKDVMSSLDISAVTLEMADGLIGKRIDNIYHIIPRTFLIRFRPESIWLLIEVEKRIHLTKFKYPTPPKPSIFCMTLRKHLLGGKLETIEQEEFDRIVNLNISTKYGVFRIVAELFRRGNLILIDPENKVRLSMRYARMRDRHLIRNELYKTAPSSGINPLTLTSDQFEKLREIGDEQLLKALTKIISIGPLHAKELLTRSELDYESYVRDLTQNQFETLFKSILSIKEKIIRKEYEPAIICDEKDQSLDTTPFPLRIYQDKNRKEFKTYNEAVDEFFSKQTTTAELHKVKKVQDVELARLSRILEEQKKQKTSLEEAVKKNKEIADTIYLNLHILSEITTLIEKEKVKGTPLQDIENLTNKITTNNKQQIITKILPEEARLKVGQISIHIRHDKTPQQVAKQYYDASKKASQKLKGLQESVNKIETKLRSVEEETIEKKVIEKIPKRKREKVWYEKFHWFKSSDGFLIMSGKDASTNDLLIRKYLNKDDLVFHAEIQGAPFTIVRTEGKSITPQTIKEAAQATAARSKAWSLNLTAVNVYWVNPDQVETSAPSGEYLGKGQFMIRGKRNYDRGVELKIAIGVREENENVIFVAGPSSAIEKHAEAYVELVPGRTSSGKLAKKIIELLKASSRENISEKIDRTNLDEVARLIPAGKGEITIKGKILSL